MSLTDGQFDELTQDQIDNIRAWLDFQTNPILRVLTYDRKKPYRLVNGQMELQQRTWRHCDLEGNIYDTPIAESKDGRKIHGSTNLNPELTAQEKERIRGTEKP